MKYEYCLKQISQVVLLKVIKSVEQERRTEKMKKSLLWVVVLILSISMVAAFSFVGCKAEEVVEEEAVEEEAVEEVAEEEASEEIVEELTTVTWGIDSFLTTFPQRVAEELGYFEEEGVDIQLRISALGVESMDQIIAQEVDLGNGAHWALVNRMSQPNIGLGGFILDWSVPVLLMVAPEIEELSDLEGKNIATINGSVWDWFIFKTLEAAGLTETDVNLLNFSSPVDYLGAAVRGDIDAGWFWEANLIKAKEALEPMGWIELVGRGDIASDASIKGHGPLPISLKAATEKPEALAGALIAYQRASDWISENPEEAVEMASRLMGMAVEDAEAILPYLNYYVGFPKEYVDLMKNMKVFALEKGYIEEEKDYDFDEKVMLEPMKLAFPDMTFE